MQLQKLINLYKDGKIPKETMVKAASFKTRLMEKIPKMDSNWKKMLLFAGGSTLAGAGGIGVYKGLDELETQGLKKKKEPAFQNMLGARPELKQEDEDLVRKYFDTLYYFSPSMARDPLASGAFIQNTLAYEDAGGPPYSSIATLVDTEKKMRDANPLARSHSESIAEATHKSLNKVIEEASKGIFDDKSKKNK